MFYRVMGILLFSVVYLCSCGGGSDESGWARSYMEWESEPFRSLAVSNDGRFVSVRLGNEIQVYEEDLVKAGGFAIDAGLTFDTPTYLPHFSSPLTTGYQVYVGIRDENEGEEYLTNPYDYIINQLNINGEVDWSTTLSLEGGYGEDVEITDDGTMLIGNSAGIEAIGPGGVNLWYADCPAENILQASNGRIYTAGNRSVTTLTSEGSVIRNVNVDTVTGASSSISDIELLKTGSSPLILFGNREILIVNDNTELLHRIVPNDPGRLLSFNYPLLDPNGVLYCIHTSAQDRQGTGPEADQHWLHGYDTATGELVVETALPDDNWARLLGINPAGNLVVAGKTNDQWTTLLTFNKQGLSISEKALAYPSFNDNSTPRLTDYSTGGILVSAAGVVYYQTKIKRPDNQWAYNLVAMDLNGNVLGTVESDIGYWITVF